MTVPQNNEDADNTTFDDNDVDYDFAYDSLEDESIGALYSSSDEENDENQEEVTNVPFWFSYEEPSHIARIVKSYAQHLNLNTQIPLGDCRRLPSFVGRIERQPVFHEEVEFSTLDVVQIYRRDIRQVGSTVSMLEEKILLTAWDDDGVPIQFDELEERVEIDRWLRCRILDRSSFIYCVPVWCSNVEYVYEVTPERKPVGYAKEPFNFTKYIPEHYLPPTPTE